MSRFGKENPLAHGAESKAEQQLVPVAWPIDFPLSALTPFPTTMPTGSLGVDGKTAHRLYPTYHKQLEDKGFILSHTTPPIPLDSLAQDNPDIRDLLRRQNTMRFPTAETLTRAEIAEWRAKFGKRIKLSDAYTLILNEKGFPGDPQPDLTKPEYTGPIDENINIFMALKLINHPEIRAQFPTPLELYHFAQQHRIKIDFSALKDGFIELFESSIQSNLIKIGALDRVELQDMYKRAAIWIAEIQALRIKVVFSHLVHMESRLGVFPYPTEIRNKRNPNLVTLPYILSAQILFMRGLPDIIPQGKFYSLETMAFNIKRTNQFIQGILSRKLTETNTKVPIENRESIQASIERIRAICDRLNRLQTDLFEHYCENEQLLNKTISTAAVPPAGHRLTSSYGKFLGSIFGSIPVDIPLFFEYLNQVQFADTEYLEEQEASDQDPLEAE